ncbi:MAG: hypothetical protein GX168_01420 [Bacteroidales bacterium]|jgi:hypothetical protein|nr:hypothetical protein [Bacteroidales bacterium]
MSFSLISGFSRRTISFVSLILILLPAVAQTRITSPYSRFGVGELLYNQNFRNLGMGGLGIGYRSNLSVNDVNPASYTAIDSTSFVFEATAFSHFYHQTTRTEEQIGNYTSLANLSFSFPVTRWWGVGIGLKPFSAVGYKVISSSVDEEVGTVNYLYEGSGGINQVFIGNSFNVYKGLSLGMNASYLFGSMERHTTVNSDSAGFFQTNHNRANQVNDLYLGFGAQYFHKFSDSRNLTLGVIFGPGTDISTREMETVQRLLPGFTTYDTISHYEGVKGSLYLPSYWGAGFFARLNNQWAGGMDFKWQNWEKFELYETQQNLNNTYQIGLGVQHNPNVQTYSNFFSRLEYRAGLRYGQTYLNLNEQAINEFGISFGVSMPVRRTLNGLNVSFELGQRGSTDNNLIKENLYRINIGVNIQERWFVRRRFY